MKGIITNIIKYLLKEYPHKSEMSASRLTKMIYLIDWKNAIDNGSQVTDAKWHFDHYGPYVDNFVKVAKENEDIKVENTSTYYGGKKQLFTLSKDFNSKIEISSEHKKIADFVISATKDKHYEEFIKLIYSTYPILSNDRYNYLDLVGLAKKYKEISHQNSNK
jgi:predicted metallo-beta-lactamase superfamily hydrolase